MQTASASPDAISAPAELNKPSRFRAAARCANGTVGIKIPAASSSDERGHGPPAGFGPLQRGGRSCAPHAIATCGAGGRCCRGAARCPRSADRTGQSVPVRLSVGAAARRCAESGRGSTSAHRSRPGPPHRSASPSTTIVSRPAPAASCRDDFRFDPSKTGAAAGQFTQSTLTCLRRYPHRPGANENQTPTAHWGFAHDIRGRSPLVGSGRSGPRANRHTVMSSVSVGIGRRTGGPPRARIDDKPGRSQATSPRPGSAGRETRRANCASVTPSV